MLYISNGIWVRMIVIYLFKIIELEIMGKEVVVVKINIKFMVIGNLCCECIIGIVG